MKTKKAQMSIEMLIVISVVFAIFVAALYMFSGHLSVVAHARSQMDAYSIASKIGPSINSVYLAGDGASISLSARAENTSAEISRNYLIVRSGDAYYDWPLLTNRTNASTVQLGEITMKNSNGMILIGNE